MKKQLIRILKWLRIYSPLRNFYYNPMFTLEKSYSKIAEKINGLDTIQWVHEKELGIPMDLMPNRYEGSGNSYLTKVLKDLKITDTDSIVDLGCGKASAIQYIAKFPFKKIVGVEYSQSVFLIANSNVKKLNDNRIQIIHCDAGEYEDYNEFNYIYLFNPFGQVTMKRVLDKICKSYQNNPRIISIIYLNPECHNEIEGRGVFKKVTEYKTAYYYKFFIYKTNI